jgi:hypothetical protein
VVDGRLELRYAHDNSRVLHWLLFNRLAYFPDFPSKGDRAFYFWKGSMLERKEFNFEPIENSDDTKRYFRVYSERHCFGDITVVASQLTRPRFDAELRRWCEMYVNELTLGKARLADLDRIRL